MYPYTCCRKQEKVLEIKQLNERIVQSVQEVMMKTDDIKADLKSQVKDYEEGTRESSLETYTDCFGAIDYLKLQQVLQNDLTRANGHRAKRERLQ